MTTSPQHILNDLTTTITDLILQAVGSEAVEAIFLAGSVAEGRIAYYQENGHTEIYSDLDLYVIVAPGVDVLQARGRARSVLPALPLATGEYTIFREPDIGVFTEEDLLSQPHRPGTVEIPLCYQMLHGREQIAENTRHFDVNLIGREEALYLLENRLFETVLLDEQAGEERANGHARSRFYTNLKQCLDVVSAVLIADGVFVCGLHDRMGLFRNRSDAAGIVIEPSSRDLIEYAYARIQDLPRAIREEMPRAGELRERAELLMLTTWKRIAASLFKKSPLIGWDRLLKLRCRGDSLMANLREMVCLSRVCGRSAATGSLLWAKHPAMQIRTGLRLAGLCQILADRAENDAGVPPARLLKYMGEVTAALGYSEGGVLQRARRLYETIA